MVVLEIIECSADREYDVWWAESSAGPQLHCESLHLPHWLQSSIQHRLLSGCNPNEGNKPAISVREFGELVCVCIGSLKEANNTTVLYYDCCSSTEEGVLDAGHTHS